MIATGAQRSRRWAITAALATVGLTIAAGLVAIASRSPLSSSAPVNATSARAPITALFMVLAAAGIVVIVAIVALIWPRRGSDEPEFVYERPGVSWISKLIAILLPLALGAALVVAAIVGAHGAQRASGVGNASLVGTGSAGRLVDERPSAGGGFVLPGWLPYTVIAIVALAAALAIVVLLVRHRVTDDEPRGSDVASSAVGAAIGALDTAVDPRAAVIAAYQAMEGTFAAYGIARSATEAPREYLVRLLAGRGAGTDDVRTLTGLFEEARSTPIRSPSASASCARHIAGTARSVGKRWSAVTLIVELALVLLAALGAVMFRGCAAPRPDRARRGAAPI